MADFRWGSRCAECGKIMEGGHVRRCEKGGYCSWHIPDAARESMADMYAALKAEFESRNCTCKFLHYVAASEPCGKCVIGNVLAKAEGRQ